MNVARRGCKAPVVAPHLHRMSFRLHPAMASAPPASVDLRETGLVAAVKDQSQTGSCTGHSSSGATETVCALAGQPLGFVPSEIDMYRGARSVERARVAPAGAALASLVDQGAMTEDILSFVATFGIRGRYVAQTSDGRNSDVELATVNDDLKFGDLERDATKLIIGPYAIDPMAPDAELQVQSAIAAKIPVRVDAFVDSAFEDWTPSKAPIPAPDMNDSQGGGHAVYLVGYGLGLYILRNSWGTSWGASGDCIVSSAWLRASWALYPWTVKVTA